jgi:hypothetical protein
LRWFLCGIKFDNIDFSLPSLRDKVQNIGLVFATERVPNFLSFLGDRVPYVLSHAGLAWLVELGDEGFVLSGVTFSGVDFSFIRCVECLNVTSVGPFLSPFASSYVEHAESKSA